MSRGPEWELVERPLLDHLALLGWRVLRWGDRSGVDRVERVSKRDVLLERRLAHALLRINPGPDGDPWLDEGRIAGAIAELRTAPVGAKLLEANRESTRLLLEGVTVAGLDDWDGGREQAIRFIDSDDVDANDFLAVSQFPVAGPGRAPDIAPDVTLFVNGIPLVVIEAKAPGDDGAITTAVKQLLRYANQRDGAVPEGAEQLFATVQFNVATTGERAESGTFSGSAEHYHAWKDPYPATVDDVAASLGKSADAVTQQEVLTAGMLDPERLLDIVRHFALIMEIEGGKEVKVVARYQQYRGARKAIERLANGRTRADSKHDGDGDVDRRGGIVWHTQGSGKSLTMVFLVRAMRSHPRLRAFKVVAVTDRTNLEEQLGETAALTGQTVLKATSAADLRKTLARPGPDLVMAMIQKYRDGDISEPVNDADEIVVLIDEAHRSHGSTLHANLLAAIPNAARVGFTGTPIIMGARRRTEAIFGGYLDTYTLTEAEADGATVPIFYEGRTTDAAVAGASRMDEVFYRWFGELTDDQRDDLQRRYANVPAILESPELIAAKARDLLRHYVSTVLPGRFKGMVVATSRLACIRYHDALNNARDELVAELDARRTELLALDPSDDLDSDDRFLRAALPDVELLRDLAFAPVISGDHNDPPEYQPWTDPLRQRVRIESFKKPLDHATETHDPTAIVIVKSMLLTGFDAPNAQVLYLDRLIQEAELLQAIARVNRTGPAGKHAGLVVDYYGVSAHLGRALAAYTADDDTLDPDVDGALRPLQSEIDKLDPQSQRLRQLFVQRGVEPAPTSVAIEACVQLLADERLSAEFDVALKTFLTTFDTVLPRPAALPYADAARVYPEIQIATRRRYRDDADGDFDPHKYAEKVRRLVDDHLTVLDLSTKIASFRITDPDFRAHLAGMTSNRAAASEMEHALRHHVREHLDVDPAYYRKLSERIDEILHKWSDNWDQLVIEFGPLIDEARSSAEGSTDGLVVETDAVTGPFHRLLAESVSSSSDDAIERLTTLAAELLDHLSVATATVGFWDSPVRQDGARRTTKQLLDNSDLFAFEDLDRIATDVMDLASARRDRLQRGDS